MRRKEESVEQYLDRIEREIIDMDIDTTDNERLKKILETLIEGIRNMKI